MLTAPDGRLDDSPYQGYVYAYPHKTAYRPDEAGWLTAIDPLFPFNHRRHPSLGRACRAGSSVLSVDGDGTVRRCHFIKAPLGNLYDPDFERLLMDRPCTNATCGCHMGYVHMNELGLYDVFGDGVLERIPALDLRLRLGANPQEGSRQAASGNPSRFFLILTQPAMNPN